MKTGLFTSNGRDLAGQVWFDDLAVQHTTAPDAWLLGNRIQNSPRPHASHKGTFGQVAVVGGACGMQGAALLAARAALHAGAGRVYVALLATPAIPLDLQQTELMFKSFDELDLAHQVVVCGCGGAQAVAAVLGKVLSSAHKVVLDADALNAIAHDPQLQTLVQWRRNRSLHTVLTPHPLEAARLLSCTAAQVQADRLKAAQTLADQFLCTVVLKGSGSVIAAPGQIPFINSTGNARLATAGTGDVLAGMISARLAMNQPTFQAACAAVFEHGQAAEKWPAQQTLTAGQLAMQAWPNQT